MKKGFTLLELLVVIGIIAILISMAAVSYTSAQKKARDSRRNADVSALQKAMEQYYSLCKNLYPVIAGETATTTVNIDPANYTTGFNTVSGSCNGNSVTLLKNVPQDPLGANYQCVNCTTSSYTICPPVKTGAGPGGADSFFETTSNILTSSQACASNQQ